jgi:hypothetical protein
MTTESDIGLQSIRERMYDIVVPECKKAILQN